VGVGARSLHCVCNASKLSHVGFWNHRSVHAEGTFDLSVTMGTGNWSLKSLHTCSSMRHESSGKTSPRNTKSVQLNPGSPITSVGQHLAPWRGLSFRGNSTTKRAQTRERVRCEGKLEGADCLVNILWMITVPQCDVDECDAKEDARADLAKSRIGIAQVDGCFGCARELFYDVICAVVAPSQYVCFSGSTTVESAVKCKSQLTC
jgi:hypothetical protein